MKGKTYKWRKSMEESYSAVTHDELVEVEGPEYVFPEQNPQVMIFKPTILQSSTAGTKRVMEKEQRFPP